MRRRLALVSAGDDRVKRAVGQDLAGAYDRAPLPTGYLARGFRVVAAVTIFLATTSGAEAVRGLSADSSRLATDLAWLA